MADGKVFLYYYKAADEPVVLNTYARTRADPPAHESIGQGLRRRHVLQGSDLTRDEYVRLRANIYAEDHIICMDAETGKTLVGHGPAGDNAQHGRSCSSKWEPAYADGMLAAANEAGRLCGIDADTGKIVWTWVDEPVAKAVAQKLEAAAKKKLGAVRYRNHRQSDDR